MEYEVVHNEEANRFEVNVDGHIAVSEYRDEGDHWDVVHTFVPPALEGRGIAAVVTKALFDYAQSNNIKIRPVCSYAVRYAEKHSEYANILV